MTREIKFRAWDSKNRQMVASKQSIATIVARYLRGGFPEGHLNGNGAVTDDQYILMQFTGLKDKNGVEIYEGDIVKGQEGYLCDYKQELDTNEVVEWSVNKAGFYPFCEYDRDCGTKFVIEKCEVIGNIYQNPDLLK